MWRWAVVLYMEVYTKRVLDVDLFLGFFWVGGRLGRRHFEMIKKSVEIYEDRCGGV